MLRLFLAWRTLGLVIAFLAQHVIPSSGSFQFHLKPIDPDSLQLPSFILDSANFDGTHYLLIAKHGYGLYQQAFFPLYPLLIHVFSFITQGNYFISGFILSNVCFLIGIIVFRNYLERIGKSPGEIAWIVVFLLTFPTAFFFGAVYTESMFFLLVCVALYAMQKRAYWMVFITCVLAALTRLMGVFLLIPIVFTVMIQQKSEIIGRNVALLISPILGLSIYMLYLNYTIHNPFAFYNAVSNFNTGRSTTSLILLPQVYYRYVNIFIHAQHNFVYFVAALEFILFNLVFFVLLYDLWVLWRGKNIVNRMSLIGLNIFSLVNILLPTVTGTLTSVPRYALLSLSFFIRLGAIENSIVKDALLIVFITLFTVLLVLFTQGYFVG